MFQNMQPPDVSTQKLSLPYGKENSEEVTHVLLTERSKEKVQEAVGIQKMKQELIVTS